MGLFKATFKDDRPPGPVMPPCPPGMSIADQFVWAFTWWGEHPAPPEPALVENLCGVCRYSLLYTEKETAAKVLEIEARKGEPPMVDGSHVVIQIDRSLG